MTIDKLVNVSAGIGASLAAYAALGIDGLTVPATYALAEKYGKGKKFSSADFRDEMITGSIQTATTIKPAYTFMNYAQPAIESAVAEAGYSGLAYWTGLGARAIMNVGLYLPLVIFNYYVASYLVRRRTMKGLYRNVIKPNFKKDVIRAYKWLGVPIMVAVTLVPPSFHILASAVLRFAFRTIIGRKTKNHYSSFQYSPQPQAA